MVTCISYCYRDLLLYVLAINKNPDAPICSVADFGIVGDIFTVLLEVNAEVNRILDSNKELTCSTIYMSRHDSLRLQRSAKFWNLLFKKMQEVEPYQVRLLLGALYFLGLSYAQLETGEQNKDECYPDFEQWVLPNKQDSRSGSKCNACVNHYQRTHAQFKSKKCQTPSIRPLGCVFIRISYDLHF